MGIRRLTLTRAIRVARGNDVHVENTELYYITGGSARGKKVSAKTSELYDSVSGMIACGEKMKPRVTNVLTFY